ncbi:MAG TPA: glycosyltransferase family 29 protein [Paracoccus sp. (in: a-proteobacteria)]|uniref:glycosyltransferase family 29 protein n=1 Tax=uncultured Paracoccus sp. TaxID=189685 RepID=UPI002637EFB7|nr:glycosyltransferase family 29 protein [uncultured Paracoccus sp.]HMQ42239.1 glycosyltransferase family 29 protein [Paracoccus sp. (in: a-proteobacteria)]HMR37772.1 glycosyltransferase family 29 protein [Paracoccus sp. (in: a-proteobacteria)]
MTPLRFFAARLMRDEGLLSSLSVPQEGLLAAAKGKTVALVGNARALASSTMGPEIDGHDIVIRINRAPMPYAETHGSRTDWLGLATRLGKADRARIQPGRILWMSHKRKRLDYQSATSPGFYLHPLADFEALKTRLGAAPTTGAMLIELLLRSDLARLDLYGFDFFASKSLSGSRSAEQVPHDFDAEAAWVEGLLQSDPRLHLHRPG